ncbi:MAG TPA: dTDP-4-dehydrorhamnose 3,5-epimerase [Longimicrobiales bacterium]|nr:dTDP-4-dehydrorhamnose 3,5-epimerase [Longimicrobiales bacterium]
MTVVAMKVEETALPGVTVLVPPRFEDDRGFFSETYSRRALRSVGIEVGFVQDNHSFSRSAGTIRGLHYQAPPMAQEKLIRVMRGSVLDVAVDIRVGSPTYGTWTSVEVSAERWNQVFVPAGFAHGFCTLEPDTHVLYKVSAPWAPELEAGLAWDDPDLAIRWPPLERYLLSDKDRALPAFAGLESPFRYDASGPDAPGRP